MKKLKYLIAIIFMVCMLSPVTVWAAEKEVKVTLSKEYSSVTLTISLESPGSYTGMLVSPKGTVYDCVTVDEQTLTCTVEKISPGDWILFINDEFQTEIPKVSVSISAKKANETDVVDTSNITIGKDIVGLKTYFKNDNIVIEWTDDSVGKVNIQVIDLDTNETLANTSVEDKYFECPLGAATKNISVNIVPSSSSNVSGASMTYTYEVNNHPNAVVTLPDMEYTNLGELPVTVECEESYGIYVEVNGAEALTLDSIPVGSNEYAVPLLDDGENVVSFYIVDSLGNMRSTDATYIKDSIPPELTLAEEYDNLEVYDEVFTISGIVSNYDVFQINGADITPTTDGTFSYDITLHEGDNAISIMASDKAGNEVIYDINLVMLIDDSLPFEMSDVISLVIIIIVVLIFVIISKRKKRHSTKKNTPAPIGKRDSVDNTNEKEVEVNEVCEEEEVALNEDFVEEDDIEEEMPMVNKNPKESNIAKINETFRHMSFKVSLPKKKSVSQNESIFDIKFIRFLIAIFIVFMVLFKGVFLLSYVASGSMEPTLMTKDIVAFNRLAYLSREPQRCDVVAFKINGTVYNKRIIAIAGDEVAFYDGYVYVNGERVDESSYLDEDVETNCVETFIVPDDCVFVLGDNRENSRDSRHWDNPYISVNDIIGKELFNINELFR